MKKISYAATLIFALAFTGCDKNQLKQVGDTAPALQLKFFHAAPGTPALDAFVNGTQVSPTQVVSVTDNLLPTAITTGYVYNGVFPSSNYVAVNPGNTTIKVAASTPVPALVSTQVIDPGTVVGNFTQATASGDYYSIITSGLPGSATTPITSFLVKDVFPTAVAGKGYVRFAHMIPNGVPVLITAVHTPTGGVSKKDTLLVSGTAPATSATTAAYSTISAFLPLDMNTLSTTTYTFQAYLPGTQTTIGSSQAIAMTPGRYYTLILKGLYADYVVPNKGVTLKASARPTVANDPTRLYPEIYFNPPGLNFYTNK